MDSKKSMILKSSHPNVCDISRMRYWKRGKENLVMLSFVLILFNQSSNIFLSFYFFQSFSYPQSKECCDCSYHRKVWMQHIVYAIERRDLCGSSCWWQKIVEHTLWLKDANRTHSFIVCRWYLIAQRNRSWVVWLFDWNLLQFEFIAFSLSLHWFVLLWKNYRFGKVYKGLFKGEEVAIKQYSGLTKIDNDKEAQMFYRLCSPYVVSFYGICKSTNSLVIEFTNMALSSLVIKTRSWRRKSKHLCTTIVRWEWKYENILLLWCDWCFYSS